MPDIQVVNANMDTTRVLQLEYNAQNEVRLDETSKDDVLRHMERLWGYGVTLTSNGVPPRGDTVDLSQFHNSYC